MPDTTLEERIASLEGSYKELTKRIDDLRSEMHRGFDGVRVEMNELRTEMREMRTQMPELRAELDTRLRTEIGNLETRLRAELGSLRDENRPTRMELSSKISDLCVRMDHMRAEARTRFRWRLSLILINWLSLLAAIFLVAGRK